MVSFGVKLANARIQLSYGCRCATYTNNLNDRSAVPFSVSIRFALGAC
jgi:hypothetical protein